MQFPVEPIAPGYDAALAIAYPNAFADSAGFGSGELVAQFRADIDAEDVLFEARSGSATITIERGAEKTLVTLKVPAAATTNMRPDADVVFNLVRIDGAIKDPVPGLWHWPVRKSVTRNVA